MTTLFLCGGGNSEGVRLALNINDASSRWDEIFVLDDDPSKHGQDILGVKIRGPFSLLGEVDPTTAEVANLVARTTKGRAGAGRKIASFGLPWASLVDPTVDLRGAKLGTGVTVYRNATVSANSTLGDGSIVFAGANAGHGASIGPGAVLAPGAVINARVRVGEGVYVGTNASVLPDLSLGAWAVVGANSAVIEDVPEGATVMGVPAQVVMLASGAPPAAEPPMAPGVEVDDEASEDVTQAIEQLWKEVLHVKSVAADDNFFDIGGTSLLAVQVRLRLQDALRRPVSTMDVFRFPTPRQLSAYLSGQAGGAASKGARRAEMRRRRLART